MENENKNAPEQNKGQQKNSFHKRKHHKPKAYYMTPSDGATPAAQEKKQNTASNDSQQKSNHPKHKQKPQAAPLNATKAAPAEGETKKKSSRNNRRRKNKKATVDAVQSIPKDTLLNDTVFESTPSTGFSRSSKDKLEIPAPKMTKFSSSPEYAKYSEYEEFTYDELYNKPSSAAPAAEEKSTAPDETSKTAQASSEEDVVEVVGIKFKASGKTYYFEPCGITLKTGSYAIVKTARGLEYGEVALPNTFVRESETVPPLRPVVRVATKEDILHHAENKKKEDEAFRICNEKIIAHELDMKLIDAQYTFDNSKLLFYFTSSGRVDFRELVKDLASVFRTRIELRQIGIRDEAKMIGGFGPCGRTLCCSLFLSDFGQVSIKMAKDQNLSLNSSKISGICGRLMCCLRYEYEAYEYEIKRTPPVDTLVRTVDGVGVITETTPLSGTIKVKLNEPGDAPPKTYRREEVTILKKKKEFS